MQNQNDITKWTNFQLINIDNYNIQEDNYYYPNIMKYPGTNYFIGFISFLKIKI